MSFFSFNTPNQILLKDYIIIIIIYYIITITTQSCYSLIVFFINLSKVFNQPWCKSIIGMEQF